jgi:hypothetical protein
LAWASKKTIAPQSRKGRKEKQRRKIDCFPFSGKAPEKAKDSAAARTIGLSFILYP